MRQHGDPRGCRRVRLLAGLQPQEVSGQEYAGHGGLDGGVTLGKYIKRIEGKFVYIWNVLIYLFIQMIIEKLSRVSH